MKNLFFGAVFALILCSSCVSNIYHQYSQISPLSSNVHIVNNEIVYADNNIIIAYDFNNLNGQLGLVCINKTDENIMMRWDKSYLVVNGVAFDYYTPDKYKGSTRSSSSAYNNSFTIANFNQYSNYFNDKLFGYTYTVRNIIYNVNQTSVYVKESPFDVIPPRSMKSFMPFSTLSSKMERDCDLFMYDFGKYESDTLFFNEETSPLILRNIISYSIEGSKDVYTIENKMYKSMVWNCHSTFYNVYEEQFYCPDENMYNTSTSDLLVVKNKIKDKQPQKRVLKKYLLGVPSVYYVEYTYKKKESPKH